jgi:hypothetical protein
MCFIQADCFFSNHFYTGSFILTSSKPEFHGTESVNRWLSFSVSSQKCAGRASWLLPIDLHILLPLFSTFSLGLRIQVLPLRRGWLIDSQFVRDVSILPITFSKPTWSHDGAIRSPEPPFSDLRLDHIHKILPDGRIASVAYLHWIASSKAAQQNLELQIDNRTCAVLTKMHPFIAMCFTLVVTTHSWVLIPITISCVSLSSWQHLHEYRTHYYSFSYPI